MAHSLELLLDPPADAAIRRAWQALAEAGLPSQGHISAATNRPHITLLAAARIDPAVDDVLCALPSSLPLDCVVGAPVVFGRGTHITLARVVVPSEPLLALHRQVHDAARPFLAEPFPHSAPGQWTAHVTLGRRHGAGTVAAALAVVDTARDLHARVAGLRRWDGDNRAEHLLIGRAD